MKQETLEGALVGFLRLLLFEYVLKSRDEAHAGGVVRGGVRIRPSANVCCTSLQFGCTNQF